LSVNIRKATLSDLEVIHRIELECFAHDAFSKRLLEYFLRSPDFLTLIGFLDGEVAGFITGSIENSEGKTVGHICTLDVKRNWRRMRVGSGLLTFLEYILSEKQVEACYLEVRDDNAAAKNLYVKHGYKPLETLKDYYGFGADGIKYGKDLKTNK
jgi:ribosomal protein S18 acetylase RimI-like enzyme